MVQELLNKYIWLLGVFIKAGDEGLTLTEITRKWEYRWGSSYSRRSFCNHRNAIAEVFGVDIECDRSTNKYFIQNGADLMDSDSDSAWLINTFTVNNLLSLGRERLSGRVSVESIPSGQKWLTTLMEAMESNVKVVIRYRKYTSLQDAVYHVKPYGLKEHERRWYLLAYCVERKSLRVYSLDRILSMDLTQQKFKMPKKFDIDEAFLGSFGIYLPVKGEIKRILFRANEREAKYLRDLPMHISQKEVSDSVFELRVIPDENLVIELCRKGDRIEVLEPQDVREKVIQVHRNALKLYEN